MLLYPLLLLYLPPPVRPAYLRLRVDEPLNLTNQRLCISDLCFDVELYDEVACCRPVCPSLPSLSYLPTTPESYLDDNLTDFVTDPSNVSVDPLLHDFFARYHVSDWPYFTSDYLQHVNRHWLTFPPPSRNSHLILMAVYSFFAIFGLCGNFTVIFMISRCRSLRTPSNLLVLNLAVSDFLMISKTPVFIYNSHKEGPALGRYGCQLYGFIGGLTGTCSIMTLAAIAMDRYYVIAYPLKRDFHTNRLRALVGIFFIWLYALGFSSVPLLDLGIKPYIPEGYLTSCSFDYLDQDLSNKVFIFGFFCAAWVFPFTIIVISYVGICRTVLVVGSIARRGQEKEKRKREIRLAVVVVFVISVWFVAWTPYAIVALLGLFGQKHLITPTISMVPAIFCKTASCIDPFIYALNHPRLRKELSRCLFPKRHELERVHNTRSQWRTEVSQSSVRVVRPVSKHFKGAEVLRLEDVGRNHWRKSDSEESGRTGSIHSVELMNI